MSTIRRLDRAGQYRSPVRLAVRLDRALGEMMRRARGSERKKAFAARLVAVTGGSRGPFIERLETRLAMSVVVSQSLGNLTIAPGGSRSVPLAGVFATAGTDVITGTVVAMPVTYGLGTNAVSETININLFDSATPVTVANFLSYVSSGSYNGSFIHRSVPGFVVQGGGFTVTENPFAVNNVSTLPPIVNEYATSPRVGGKVNVRGTLAMAKQGGDPNSATSQFFFNLADNSSNLDNQNGGFTTFARVLSDGMAVVDDIATLPVFNAGGAFTDLPLADYNNSGPVAGANLVRFNNVAVVANPNSVFSYDVFTSNPSAVSASISGGAIQINALSATAQPATVTVTATSLTGATTTTSFTVGAVNAPALGVSFQGAPVTSGQGTPVSLGSTTVGQAISGQFTLSNTGGGTVTIGNIALPAGVSIVGTAPTSIAAGASATLSVQVTSSTPTSVAGNIVIPTNGAGSGQFTIPVSATVTAAQTTGAVSVVNPIASVVAPFGSTQTVSLAGVFKTTSLDAVTGTVVTMPVTYGVGANSFSGAVNFELFDQATPLTVANFLRYVNSGSYAGSVIHRSLPGFVIQGGGYRVGAGAADLQAIPTAPPIANEFASSPRVGGKVNVRGTLAVARTFDPNSATSQFFVNLVDNSSNLDTQSGGFATFGRVIGNGLNVVDQIASIPTVDLGGQGLFSSVPLADYNGTLAAANYVRFGNVAVVPNPKGYFTYTASSSDPGNVAVSVTAAGALSVQSLSSTASSAIITVTATDLAGASVKTTFSVTTGNVPKPVVDVLFGGQVIPAGQGTPIGLGSTQVGQSRTVQFTVRNTGTAAAVLGQVTLPGGLSVVTGLPSSLAVGASANLILAVDTSAARVISGNVTIATDGVSGGTIAVPVSGSVVSVASPSLAVAINGSSVSSGQAGVVSLGTARVGDTLTVTVDLSNTGSGVLHLSSLTPPTGIVLSGSLPGSVDPGGSVRVTLTVSTDSVRTVSGNLVVASDSAGGAFSVPVTATVQGNASTAPVVSLAPVQPVPASVTAIDLSFVFRSTVAIDGSSLDDGNVTVTDPAGATLPVTLVTYALVNSPTEGTSVSATYRLSAPNGGFKTGRYFVNLLANQVRDTLGNPAVGNRYGLFTVTAATTPKVGGADSNFGNGSGSVTSAISSTSVSVLDTRTDGDGFVTAGIDAQGRLILSRLSADGTLDQTFGTQGSKLITLPTGFSAVSLSFDPDGKILLTGTSGTEAKPALLRRNGDGTADTSLGNGAPLLLTDFDPLDTIDAATTLTTGRIIVAGARSGGKLVVARVTPDGVLDPTFGTRGQFTRLASTGDVLTTIAIAPNGNIMAAGTVGSKVAVIRLSARGAEDKAFSRMAGGVLPSGTGFATADKVVVQGDGKIVFSSSTAASGSGADAGNFGSAVVRLNATGTPDSTFNKGNGGTVIVRQYQGQGSSTPASFKGASMLAAVTQGSTVKGAISSKVGLTISNNRIQVYEANNVTAGAVLTVTRIIADGANLTPGLTLSKASLKKGQKGMAVVTVANNGTLPTSGTFSAKLVFGNSGISKDLTTSQILKSLKNGVRQTFKFNFTVEVDPGSYDVYLVFTPIDPLQDINAGDNTTATTSLKVT